MKSKIQFYNSGKGWGMIDNPLKSDTLDEVPSGIYFHISNVLGELRELIEAEKIFDEPITFDIRNSKVKADQKEAYNIKLDLNLRSVGYVTDFENGFGWIKDFHSGETFFAHYSKIKGSAGRFISIEKDDPVVFTKSNNEKGNEALDIVKVDTRSALEFFSEFNDFNKSLNELQSKAEDENWDYINKPTSSVPVLWSYINHSFERILSQGKVVFGKSSKDNKEYAYFNTGLVTPFQDEIFGYFIKIHPIGKSGQWHLRQPQYEFLEFETEQSHYRKYFPSTPDIATYFAEAEVRELVFDTSLNNGKIIIDREHIKNRKARFPSKIADLDDEAFFDQIAKSIELATKRVRRNYKTAIPHFYDGKIQFLLPLCMQTKKDADLALVVNKEEYVYKAHTVLTLDQAYNNARLLAKPDREWLNP
jgi:cold shock CspA family protein